MASDGQPVQIPAVSLVQGSQAPKISSTGGKVLPPSGSATSRTAEARTAAASTGEARTAEPRATATALSTQVALLNKNLNDSGRPLQFRVAPNSGDKTIQEINPANGEVIAEYSASEFAALARSLGISGAVVNRRA